MSSDVSSQNRHKDFQFTVTQDWFSSNIDTWTALFPLVHAVAPRILEIGSWEGRSAVFLLSELCKSGGEIVCIDHFDLMQTPAGRERHAKIMHNLALTGKPFRVLGEFSVPALVALLQEEMMSQNAGYDWIYVDGSHEADDTLLDGELAWRLARNGAIVIFDDYNWDKEPDDSVHHPKRGIDTFMKLHEGEYECLSRPSQYQMILRKTTDMRIGFLVKEKVDSPIHMARAFGYGINIALAVDSSYAVGAAVAIRSSVERTRSRMTIYIIDCGLAEQDKGRIRTSIPTEADATVVFISLLQDGLAADMGIVWAKIDMLAILPVERILYLDADVLVRSDLKELWDMDLDGHTIGAVRDIGYPNGHEGVERRAYFNAGVMLIDLAKARGHFDELKTLGRKMKGARFQDQDTLNMHFSRDWLSVDVKWNGQGLGTYAEYPSIDRDNLVLETMKNPNIVHFTGPVNPTLAEVLNPFVQPYTAKPWGYAGAPGHPYQGEWWEMVQKTAWNGLRSSKDFQEMCAESEEKAIAKATEDFRNRLHQLVRD